MGHSRDYCSIHSIHSAGFTFLPRAAALPRDCSLSRLSNLIRIQYLACLNCCSGGGSLMADRSFRSERLIVLATESEVSPFGVRVHFVVGLQQQVASELNLTDIHLWERPKRSKQLLFLRRRLLNKQYCRKLDDNHSAFEKLHSSNGSIFATCRCIARRPSEQQGRGCERS